ncbi:nitrogen fixation protein NifZ [Endothiovibrio diazotrophicus]
MDDPQRRYDYGEAVRVIRNIRNDGTFPGIPTGTLLIRRGSVGHVRDVGTFLQDQVIYSVHFLEEDKLVGIRAEELIGVDEPWVPSRFESREKVRTVAHLSVAGEVIAERGAEGEILKVIRDQEAERVTYHVRFPGHTLQVPEPLLERIEEAGPEEDADSQ